MSVSRVPRSAVDAQLRDEIYVAVKVVADADVQVVEHLYNEQSF